MGPAEFRPIAPLCASTPVAHFLLSLRVTHSPPEITMPPAPPLTLKDLARVLPIVRREAWRALHRRGLPQQDREDLQQDMLVDLLKRMPAFDGDRGTLDAFVTVCCRHHAMRRAERLSRDRARRHSASFDDQVGRDDGCGARLTLGEVLPENVGLSAWWGQPTDAIAAAERRLDLERAASCIDQHDHPLCRMLSAEPMHVAIRGATVSRATIYRRVAEMRLNLLAAGIASAG